MADAQTVFSIAFRLCAYLYLRVIPATPGKFVLPALYVLYLASAAFRKTIKPSTTPPDESDVKKEFEIIAEVDKTTGIQTVDVKDVTPHPPASKTPALWAFLLDLPSVPQPWRVASLLFNTLLLVFAIDMALVPLIRSHDDLVFSRVGAVDSSSAKIVVRYPGLDDGQVRLLWRQITPGADTPSAWKDGPVVSLSEEEDWVGVGKLSRLWPSTEYEYRLAAMNTTILPYPSEPLKFRTYPDHRLTTGTHFRFLASSCILPNFPYQPLRSDRIKGFDYLAKYTWPRGAEVPAPPPAHVQPAAPTPEAEAEVVSPAPSVAAEAVADPVVENTIPLEVVKPTAEVTITPEAAPLLGAASPKQAVLHEVRAAPSPPTPAPVPGAPTEFLMMLGDFVYADVPVHHGDELEKFRRLYRRNYASPSFRKVYERLPIYHIYDDHEFKNDYAGESNDTAPFVNASSAYRSYNHIGNYDGAEKDNHFYDFRYGDVAFFVMDTRRYRSARGAEVKTMLGDKQSAAIHSWLGRVNTTATFKFIVSSVPFSTLWKHDAAFDSWGGFLQERDALLAAMSSVPNVVVISGDRHQFAAVEFNGGRVLEISNSPLSMFYIPFISTLNKESVQKIEKKVSKVTINEEGAEEIVEVTEYEPQERVIKYIPRGNYKFSSFEVDTRDRNDPRLKIEAVINGKVAWQLNIIGQPVQLSSSTALGLQQLSQNLKGILDKIGLLPAKWF